MPDNPVSSQLPRRPSPASRQPRLATIDALDRLTPVWDSILSDARLATRPDQVNDIEGRVQRFADEAVQAVRGPGARRPSAAPLCFVDGGALF